MGSLRQPRSHIVRLGAPLNPAGYDVPSRVAEGETIHLSPEDVANYFVVFVADLADQWSDVITYRAAIKA